MLIADLESELKPFAESLIGPEETLLGACVASEQRRLRGWMVAVAVTDRHLYIQKLKRGGHFTADGPPLAVAPDDVVNARGGRGGTWGASPTAEILDSATSQLKLETASGEKVKLMMMNGEGKLFGGAGGGDIQRFGVRALGEWFERNFEDAN